MPFAIVFAAFFADGEFTAATASPATAIAAIAVTATLAKLSAIIPKSECPDGS